MVRINSMIRRRGVVVVVGVVKKTLLNNLLHVFSFILHTTPHHTTPHGLCFLLALSPVFLLIRSHHRFHSLTQLAPLLSLSLSLSLLSLTRVSLSTTFLLVIFPPLQRTIVLQLMRRLSPMRTTRVG